MAFRDTKTQKALPIAATPVLLTGTLAQVGAVVPLAGLTRATLWGSYARHASSSSGTPKVALFLSPDPPGDVAPTHWFPLYAADLTTLAAGALAAYPLTVTLGATVTGTRAVMWPGAIDVAGAHWLYVAAADADGTNCGTLALSLTGD